jgi:hypothetical protein
MRTGARSISLGPTLSGDSSKDRLARLRPGD